MQLYLIKKNKNGWKSNITWLAQLRTGTCSPGDFGPPSRSPYTGLDSHTGSGVRGAAKPDQLGRDVCTLPQT